MLFLEPLHVESIRPDSLSPAQESVLAVSSWPRFFIFHSSKAQILQPLCGLIVLSLFIIPENCFYTAALVPLQNTLTDHMGPAFYEEYRRVANTVLQPDTSGVLVLLCDETRKFL